jgi:AbrB family looped-hinge helix DNA binding protein
MRITSKGQVTIPVEIRERAGLLPNTEVEFAYEEGGDVRLFPAKKKGKRKTRGEKLVEHLRRHGRRHPIGMTTDEIMALTRGED